MTQTRVAQNEFESFKFPEETRGQDLLSANWNELAVIERESREACERIGVRFNTTESKASSASAEAQADIDDEFFSVTVDDLRSRLSDLKRAQNEEAPLMTREMREMEKDKRAMKYSKVVIRISFKNGTILQVGHLTHSTTTITAAKNSNSIKT